MPMYKMITADMTDEQILAPVQRAKATLASKATEAVTDDHMLGERLVAAAEDVAVAEAVASAALRYRNVLKSEGVTALALTQSLMGLLVRGADDSWSGRGNDLKRTMHDAVRKFAEDQFDHLRYGDQGGLVL